jgi:thioredoxin-like negative regulator of GroEL
VTTILPPPSNKSDLQKGISVKPEDSLHGVLALHFRSARSLKDYCAQSSVPVLLDFSAVWCGPCKSMARALEKLTAHFAERMLLLQIDIDKAPRIAKSFDVMAVPTLVLLSGKKALVRLEGAHSFTELKKALEKHLPTAEKDVSLAEKDVSSEGGA